MTTEEILINSPLGKKLQYEDTYAPHLLFAIPRQEKRDELRIQGSALPFKGVDIWNAFEISWLNEKGKPCMAIGEFIVPCNSRYLFESKSFKYYLNSFNRTIFKSLEVVKMTLESDLFKVTNEVVQVKLIPIAEYQNTTVINNLAGECLDDQDLNFHVYNLDPSFLSCTQEQVSEQLCSNLLKSNCLVTGQPDWGSVQITYTGRKIDRAGLLKYLVSFHSHDGFAEHCVERIFVDLMQHCAPEKLAVYARYTRRGGLDINPWRSTIDEMPANDRLCRQ